MNRALGDAEREWLTQLEETGKIHGDLWALSARTRVLEGFAGADGNVACSKMILAAISTFRLDVYM